MTSLKIPASKRQAVPRLRFSHGLTAQSLLAVEQRLTAVERELRVQFTRIAQLQAELDLQVATHKHPTDAEEMSLQAPNLFD